MISKKRIFFNWILSVLAGSAICTLFAHDNFHADLFIIFLLVSTVLGLIPLTAMIVLQYRFSTKSITNEKLNFFFIATQIVCYLLIFTTLLLTNRKTLTFDLGFFLIGLPYLGMGIILTLLSSNSSVIADNEEVSVKI